MLDAWLECKLPRLDLTPRTLEYGRGTVSNRGVRNAPRWSQVGRIWLVNQEKLRLPFGQIAVRSSRPMMKLPLAKPEPA